MENQFKQFSASPNHPNWEKMIMRKAELYKRETDLRSDFERDYTRVIHSQAYRRLKRKTQVFFSPENDHICTRIEHVNHVESISYTIAKYLGLNTDLTKAISVAHDLGHSPFGHAGEKILSQISMKDLGYKFWHEKNGLDFVDKIELLEDSNKNKNNLNLTYAVRDGIISHCGEINENSLKPRDEFIDLDDYTSPNQYSPYTWEGCVVKISDKISYIGRDIEDAITLGILDKHLQELYDLLDYPTDEKINNTVIINYLISDVCENSSPEKGLCFSEQALYLMNKIKDFNYKNIYFAERLQPSIRYFELVLPEIYNTLYSHFDSNNTINNLNCFKKFYPKLITGFTEWILNYVKSSHNSNTSMCIFDLSNKLDYAKAILYYISGMTDNYAIEIYNEIIRF